MAITVQIVNAFVDGNEGGNPAGVVLDADELDHQAKLDIAKRVGLSETAFVSRSDKATFKLDFYTPSMQIAHCGHATIAAFCRMRELGRIGDGTMSKETIDGNRVVIVEGETAYMQQRTPVYTPVGPGSDLERRVFDSLSIDCGRLADGLGLAVVNTGNSFLIVPMRDEASLSALRPNLQAVSLLSEELDLVGFYPFAALAPEGSRAATARMFAPRYGINEESATGMAAGPLACYLHQSRRAAGPGLQIEQGHFMQPASPSVIQVNLQIEGDAVTGLMAGGRARSVAILTL